MEEKKNMQGNPLGYAPLGGLMRKFAIPSIISLLVTAAYNMTDQIFIGHVVGMLGNAATNVAFPVTTLLMAFAQLIGVGTAANFNINLGAKRLEEAKKFIGTGLTMMSVAGLLFMAVVLLFKTPILLICGATETVLPLAQDYLGIAAIGIPFLLFTSAASMIIRADGSPSYSMTCMVSGAVLNVFLDWLFLFALDWGIQGAALATIVSQMFSFLRCIRYFPKFKTFPIRKDMLGLKWAYVGKIAKLGTSNFINHTIMMMVNIVLNNSLTYYGALSIYGKDIPLAVSGVAAKLNSIMISFVVGLAQGCQPILGFNMGAKNYDRVKATYKKAVKTGLCFSAAAFLLFQFFPREVISIFGVGNELYFQFAEKYLRVYLFMVFLFGLQPITVNYFTSIGNVKQGIILSASRQGFILIPMLLLLPLQFGLNGVLLAGPISDALAALLSITMVAINFRGLSRQQAALQKKAEG
ncbi:MATE family efflux transporter [Anaerotignum sp.]|nr:MATE family efflux transporter [Anaerotignum sp.]MBQ7759468.1 MATE family efflux transporter [Anaerotignum sp.]